MNAYEELKNSPKSVVERWCRVMNSKGIVIETDGLSFSSVIGKGWCNKCTKYLIELGYTGGPIKRINNGYHPGYGTIYGIYDSKKERVARRHIKPYEPK
ncbi:TPA: hypothetical protein KDY51_004973 [Vibrio parahaemolyticus]|nr:hypothetical protein [Vibrio parahaemolyticus]